MSCFLTMNFNAGGLLFLTCLDINLLSSKNLQRHYQNSNYYSRFFFARKCIEIYCSIILDKTEATSLHIVSKLNDLTNGANNHN